MRRCCGDAQLFYTQKVSHQFRFSLRSQADSPRFGEELNSPLLAYVAKEDASASASLPDRLSFAQARPDHVHIAVVKRAEDGQGLIVRLVETGRAERATQAELRLFRPIKRAVKTNLIEENESDIRDPTDRLAIPIARFGIETVRVSF